VDRYPVPCKGNVARQIASAVPAAQQIARPFRRQAVGQCRLRFLWLFLTFMPASLPVNFGQQRAMIRPIVGAGSVRAHGLSPRA